MVDIILITFTVFELTLQGFCPSFYVNCFAACPHISSSCPANLRFAHQPLQQNPIMHGLSHMGGQGVHPGMRPNQMLAEQQQQQQQQQQAAQQQQQYLRQQALRVRHLIISCLSRSLLCLGLVYLLKTQPGESENEAVCVHYFFNCVALKPPSVFR